MSIHVDDDVASYNQGLEIFDKFCLRKRRIKLEH